MVFRIFVEKKPGLDHEAQALLNDLRSLLGITGLERLRVFNRYDAENITPELFSYAVPPQLDDKLKPGCRVLVPFGGGGHGRQGMVFELTASPPEKRAARIIRRGSSS